VTHVPKGADALNDLLAGRLQFMFTLGHPASGREGAADRHEQRKRSRSLPAVPTVIERRRASGRLVVLFAPKPIVAQLNRTVNEILALPSIEKQMMVREPILSAERQPSSASSSSANTRVEIGRANRDDGQ
jgi:hypothetical protein